MASAPGFRLRRSFVVDGLRGWRGVVWPRAANALGVGVVVVRRVEPPERVKHGANLDGDGAAVLETADLLEAGGGSLGDEARCRALLQRVEHYQELVFSLLRVVVDRHFENAKGSTVWRSGYPLPECARDEL